MKTDASEVAGEPERFEPISLHVPYDKLLTTLFLFHL